MCSKSVAKGQGGPNCPPLPEEIWLLIFETLMQNGGSWSSLATVSREWQTIAERRNFALIKLTLPRLGDFDAMTRRCRALVGCIWFCLELDQYDCRTCGTTLPPLTYDFYRANYRPIAKAFQDLFAVLSTWESNGNLKLDISIYSPSDSQHWFKYLTFVRDPSKRTLDSGSMEQKGFNNSFHDPHHDWVAGFRDSALPQRAFSNVSEDVMGGEAFNYCKWWDQLPSVPAVTTFLIRQQNRRGWEPHSLAYMLAHFPRLQEIHYEPWRDRFINPFIASFSDEAHRYLFESLQGFKKTLKKVVVCENFNQQYSDSAGKFWGGAPDDCATNRNPSPEVAQAIALASLQLEHLAVSFIVDASEFFQIKDSWRWPNLSSLSLTSKHLTPDENPTEIKNMLQAAAAAVMKMPQLETLEIWTGRKGLAALFKYQASHKYRQATITWRGTWKLTMEQSVIQAWDAVLHQWGGWGRLTFVQEMLDEAVIKSHADAIHYLKLSNEVIRPISLKQIRFEQKAMEGTEDVQQV